MDTFRGLAVVAAGLFAFGTAPDAAGQAPEPAARAAARAPGGPGLGRIAGTVTDVHGHPLDGAMVSAFGPVGAELVVSDGDGRFVLPSLPPGRYLVQAHIAGFAMSRREFVLVTAGRPVVHAIAMSHVSPPSAPVLPALAGLGFARPRTEAQPPDADRDAPAAGGPDATHDHTRKAWRLRRARRSVLKQAERGVGVDAPDAAPARDGATAWSHPARSLASFASGLRALPLSGEVNLLTRGTLEPASALGSTRPGGVANLSVGAPAWRGDWTAHGAMNAGDVSSWFASGAYLAEAGSTHAFGVEAAYGRQRYDGANPLALSLAPETRVAASVGAFDRWTVSPRLSLEYGGRYSRYDYIDGGLFSPRAAVTVTAAPGLRFRLSAAQDMIAPGAETFLPAAGPGLWLPQERAFAAMSRNGRLHPERTRHFDVGVERDLAGSFVVGVRRFHQDVANQLVTLFGAGGLDAVPAGFYHVARAGSVESSGWIVSVRRELGRRVRGSVDFSVVDARWGQGGVGAVAAVEAPGVLRPAVEQFHDISATIETEVPETSTRVSVRCRVSGAFEGVDPRNPGGLDARFDLLIHQALPFTPVGGGRWEALLAVRSLFFDPRETASLFSELLVIRPPRQVVGGVVVHF